MNVERSQAQSQTGVCNAVWAAYTAMLEPSTQVLEICRPAGKQLQVVVHDGAQPYNAVVDESELLRLVVSVAGVGKWLVDLSMPVTEYMAADQGMVLCITMAAAMYSGSERSIVGMAEWGDSIEPFGSQTCVFGKVREVQDDLSSAPDADR